MKKEYVSSHLSCSETIIDLDESVRDLIVFEMRGHFWLVLVSKKSLTFYLLRIKQREKFGMSET